jgi:rhodanese-related sulfurtransferase
MAKCMLFRGQETGESAPFDFREKLCKAETCEHDENNRPQYHDGGCASCGFSPTETLASVCARNENLPVEDVIATIIAGQEADRKMEISPVEVAERLKSGKQVQVIDVRAREEWDAVHIAGSTFFTQDLMNAMMSEWPKEREVIFVCHHGHRSVDAAAFFAGHGFQNVRSMTGGIDAWSLEVDPDLPRYHVE